MILEEAEEIRAVIGYEQSEKTHLFVLVYSHLMWINRLSYIFEMFLQYMKEKIFDNCTY